MKSLSHLRDSCPTGFFKAFHRRLYRMLVVDSSYPFSIPLEAPTPGTLALAP